jgi:hypothetical protein
MAPHRSVCAEPLAFEPVEIFRIFVVGVIAQLILDEQKDEETDHHSDGQACDVDKRESFFPYYISPGNFQVVG